MTNKVLESVISKLVDDQVFKSEELKKEIKKLQCINNTKRYYTRKNTEGDERRIKQLNNQNKKSRKEIADKKIENVKLCEEIEKSKVMKSLCNNVLNRIKKLDRRLEDKDKIMKELDAHEEYFSLEKEIAEEE